MSLGAEAWWSAMMAASQFEDGTFAIEDTTLEVNGGSTVDLRVRLGAKPRSDVTVALSETSDLISLGTDSLTFTPDNWDTYQDVVVTAAGNRQEIALPATAWQQRNVTGNRISREWIPIPRPSIDAALAEPGSTTSLQQCSARSDDSLQLSTINGVDELSSAFETSGSVQYTVGSSSWLFEMGGLDLTEPYIWTPSNSSDVSALYDAIAAPVAATLTLRDYAVGTAIISLSASGPDEYSGVTGSATVTVN